MPAAPCAALKAISDVFQHKRQLYRATVPRADWCAVRASLDARRAHWLAVKFRDDDGRVAGVHVYADARPEADDVQDVACDAWQLALNLLGIMGIVLGSDLVASEHWALTDEELRS